MYIRYATKPIEILQDFSDPKEYSVILKAEQSLDELCEILRHVVLEQREIVQNDRTLEPMYENKGLKDLINVVRDAQMHIRMLGMYGGLKAVVSYMIFLEVLKKNCQEIKMNDILNCALTYFGEIKIQFQHFLTGYSEEEKIMLFSSDQLLKLFKILRDYQNNSQLEFCCIIFVERRFTAKILYHILMGLAQQPQYDFLKPQFIVGYNNNPYNETREGLYIAKQNRKIISEFYEKKVNLIVSTNVLEEGVDVPNCSLIVKFDKPVDYRSYVQSKGRARHKSSLYYIMISHSKKNDFIKTYKRYQQIEETVAQVSFTNYNTKTSITSINTKVFVSDPFLLKIYFPYTFLVPHRAERLPQRTIPTGHRRELVRRAPDTTIRDERSRLCSRRYLLQRFVALSVLPDFTGRQVHIVIFYEL